MDQPRRTRFYWKIVRRGYVIVFFICSLSLVLLNARAVAAPMSYLPSGMVEPPPPDNKEEIEGNAIELTNGGRHWTSPPEFGPGSGITGMQLFDLRQDRWELAFRLGVHEYTTDWLSRLKQADRSSVYPLLRFDPLLFNNDLNPDPIFQPIAWAYELMNWYRFVYFVIFFP